MRGNITALALAVSVVGCGSDEGSGDGGNESEVITTVTLAFAPEGGGDTVTAAFDDPDGEGGEAPTVDPIELSAGATYALSVTFENRLEDPAEDITEEVADEADQHQVFYTGTAVDGPASPRPGAPLAHAYADEDDGGLPVGLESTVVAAAGAGDLIVTLRHLPPLNDVAVKVEGLAEQVGQDGLGSIPGSTDAEVTFPVTVE